MQSAAPGWRNGLVVTCGAQRREAQSPASGTEQPHAATGQLCRKGATSITRSEPERGLPGAGPREERMEKTLKKAGSTEWGREEVDGEG